MGQSKSHDADAKQHQHHEAQPFENKFDQTLSILTPTLGEPKLSTMERVEIKSFCSHSVEYKTFERIAHGKTVVLLVNE